MAIISNAVTIADAGAVAASLGSMVHIKTLTASDSANLTFVHGSSDVVLDGTYPIYKFELINIHPETNGEGLQVNFRDGGTNYDATKTSNCYYSYHSASNTGLAAVEYQDAYDLGQVTGNQTINNNIGSSKSKACLCGEMYLFSPASTVSVKHYMIKSTTYHSAEQAATLNIGGYCNVTAAIDGVKFVMSSGAIGSGKIKLYGIKDS